MRNQFFYTAEVDGKNLPASLTVAKVIRSLGTEDGGLIIILDDFNERVTQQPDIDFKTNKVKGFKNVRETVQSEIHLNKEDAERFIKLTNIEG
jgi:hypothetical protein